MTHTTSEVEEKKHHQYKHGMYGTRIYHIWEAMLARCRNPKCTQYYLYGAKGIRVCNEWLDFRNFYADMKDSYTTELTLDRIDNNKGYSKENCRWVTIAEQNRNKRSVKLYEYQGEMLTVPQLAEKAGLDYWTLRDRLFRMKLPLNEALSRPINRRK